MRAFREDGFPVTIVRPSLTYGLSQIPLVLGSWQHPWTMIDRMRRGVPVIVPGDGTSLWTVTWNGDFADGLVGLLGREQAIGHAFHITSDEVLTWDAIYREAARAAGVEPAHRAHRLGLDRGEAPRLRGHAARRQGAQRRVRQLQDQALRPGLRVHGAVGGGRAPQPRVVRGRIRRAARLTRHTMGCSTGCWRRTVLGDCGALAGRLQAPGSGLRALSGSWPVDLWSPTTPGARSLEPGAWCYLSPSKRSVSRVRPPFTVLNTR